MTTLKLGWTNPLTDQFGAHPTFGPVLDLNDGSTFTLVSPDGLELPPPPRTLVATGTGNTPATAGRTRAGAGSPGKACAGRACGQDG